MKQTLYIIAITLLFVGIYSFYKMTPTEMDVIFDENTQEQPTIDTMVYDLDSMERRMLYDEEYERMVRDSLDKMSDDWTGTTQDDSIK